MGNETPLEVLQAATAALATGQRAALLMVVHAAGSTPRHGGAKMLVRADGSLVGTIGGGTLEERAVVDALAAMQTGRFVLKRYEFSGRHEESVGLCGGMVDVAIDVLLPPMQLIVIGAGHIAQPLVAMAGMSGVDVIVVDDRSAWANRERFPAARDIHIVPYDRQTETLGQMPIRVTPETAIVLATWGWDEPALRQVIASPAFYIGLVASRRKLKLIFDILAERGIDAALIERVHAPAGLDLGAETPAEIAVSILAEILQVRAAATGQSLTTLRKAHPRRPPPTPPSP